MKVKNVFTKLVKVNRLLNFTWWNYVVKRM